MGSDTSSAATSLPLSRLVGVGLIVFLANAVLLVLQLVAGRLLAPFIGSSLETWTSVIGVFLAGIALGNGFGGKLADRYPTPRTLAALLAVGAIAAVWMAIFPLLLTDSGVYKSIPLGPRIPLLALVLCLPAGFVLSLLTPLAIKLGLPDLASTGRVTGMVFALSTLGCLLGNYLTGFVLIPMYTINTLVFASAGALAALSLGSIVVLGTRAASEGSAQDPLLGSDESASPRVASSASGDRIQTDSDIPISSNPYAFPDIRLAFTIVFLASFGGMTLELTASRVLAGELGVSLFTWTGIIGVMLAGTALGNLTGGWITDRVNRPGSSFNPRFVLAGSLLMAAAGTVFQFVAMALISHYSLFHGLDPIEQVMGWTFCLFFLPMFALGTISPQVIRLAVPDVAHVGRVAGRVYAWSTTGAILGTFVAGYLLLSAIGMHKTLLCVSLILTLTSLVVTKVWDYNPLLYVFSIVLGGITGGVILTSRSTFHEQDLLAKLETNYYTIKVTQARDSYGDLTNIRTLTLDHLIHSSVNPNDPFFLYYKHEHVQMEFLQGARKENPNPRVLVVGGGGYTFPRYAMEVMPETQMDVVEIDPGVTWIAKNHLGLKDYGGLKIYHMDGRQYVAEKVPAGTYDLVVQDAVNDLSVPSHLLTKEYNDAVKATLKPNGVYLLTVIDSIGYGKLWKAAMLTLQQTYPAENIALLTPEVMNSKWFNISDEAFAALSPNVPQSVLLKLDPLKNKTFSWDDLVEKLTGLLDPNETKLYKNHIMNVVDPIRLKLTEESFATLGSLNVPQSILMKLNPLKNKKLSRDDLVEELTGLLDPNETKLYKNLILDHAADFSERQVYVIYASDRPLDLSALRAAVSEQVLPGFTAANGVGSVAGGMQTPGGMPHVLAASIMGSKAYEEALLRTHRILQVDLQPYLDALPRIILTDQYAPVDNLMADVFRYRYRQRPKE